MFKRFLFSFINEWVQLFGKWNWKTFTLIMVSFEDDTFTRGYEICVILLGFGFRIRYNTPASIDLFEEWEREAKEAIKKYKKKK